MSKILARVIGGGGSAGTATSNDVLSGKTFSNDDDVDIVGTATEYPTTEHHVTTADQIIIPANSHTTGNQVLKGIVTGNLTPSTIRSGKTVTINNGEKNIVSINGTYTSSISNGQQPVTADKIVSGYSGFVNGSNEIQGSIPDKSGANVTASSVDMTDGYVRMKVPSDGFYSTATYLRSAGINFGDASPSDVVSGKTFTSSNGVKVQGSATARSSGNIYGQTYDQVVVPANTHVTGDQILKGISAYGLTPENICSGQTVNIWNGVQNIISVTGAANRVCKTISKTEYITLDIRNYKIHYGHTYNPSVSPSDRWYKLAYLQIYPNFTPVGVVLYYNEFNKKRTNNDGSTTSVNTNSDDGVINVYRLPFMGDNVQRHDYSNYYYPEASIMDLSQFRFDRELIELPFFDISQQESLNTSGKIAPPKYVVNLEFHYIIFGY